MGADASKPALDGAGVATSSMTEEELRSRWGWLSVRGCVESDSAVGCLMTRCSAPCSRRALRARARTASVATARSISKMDSEMRKKYAQGAKYNFKGVVSPTFWGVPSWVIIC